MRVDDARDVLVSLAVGLAGLGGIAALVVAVAVVLGGGGLLALIGAGTGLVVAWGLGEALRGRL